MPVTATATRMLILQLALLLALVLFLFGISIPLMTITKLLIFDNTVSVMSGLGELFAAGHYLLFILIAVFSIVLPVVKMVILYLATEVMHESPGKYAKYLGWIHAYGRWAMLDVMVVAMLIVTVKLGAIASVEVHEGLYVFGASVLLIMIITHFVVAMIESKRND